MTKVTISDARKCGFCSRGARVFLLRHGFDWTEFIKHGIDADLLLKTGDAMAAKAVRQAYVRGR